MKVIDAAGIEQQSDFLALLPLFDLDKPGDDYRLILRPTNVIPQASADFSIDALLSGTHRVQLAANISLTGVSNLVGPEPTTLYVDLQNLYILTLSTTAFMGPKLVFSGAGALISFVNFGAGRIAAMGNDF